GSHERFLPYSTHRQVGYLRQKYPAELITALESVCEFVAGIRYYGASRFTDPSKSPVAFEIDEKSESVFVRDSSPHRRLMYDMYKAERENSSKFKEFLSLVDHNGLHLIDS